MWDMDRDFPPLTHTNIQRLQKNHWPQSGPRVQALRGEQSSTVSVANGFLGAAKCEGIEPKTKSCIKARVARKTHIPPSGRKWVPVKIDRTVGEVKDKVIMPQVVHGLAQTCEASQFTLNLAKNKNLGFCGGPAILIHNLTNVSFQVQRGQRIASLIVVPHDVELRLLDRQDPEEPGGCSRRC